MFHLRHIALKESSNLKSGDRTGPQSPTHVRVSLELINADIFNISIILRLNLVYGSTVD